MDSIGSGGFEKDVEIDADSLPLLDAISRRDGIRFTKPICAHVYAKPVGHHVWVTGMAKTIVEQICSRCLEFFETVVETEFSATALPETLLPAVKQGENEAEVELKTEEMDFIQCVGNTLDLGDEIAQQIIMALPFSPLCNASCKGLCIQCGANHNQVSCECRDRAEDNPFVVLKTLCRPKNER